MKATGLRGDGHDRDHDDVHANEDLRPLPLSNARLAAIGHDLRNPLHAILSSTQLLLRRETDPQAAAPLHRILNSTSRLARMIEQLLDVVRDDIAVAPEPVDLGALVRRSIEELPEADARRVTFAPVGEVRGKWDPVRLGQVVAVLLDNALAHGVADQSVRVSLDGGARDVVRLEVWNAGAIAEDVLGALFEPFHAAPGVARKPKPRGLGLGLYLARRTVLAHAGEIDVRSAADSGTAITVALPRISFAREDDDEPDETEDDFGDR